jgi:hypothetical protein
MKPQLYSQVLFSIGCVSKATFYVPHKVGEFEQIVLTLIWSNAYVVVQVFQDDHVA